MENETHISAPAADEEEALEQHTARMKRIRDEVTADIKAGRYKHDQIHPHIRGDYARETSGTETGRWPSKYVPEGLYDKSFTELYMGRFIEGMGEMMKRSERDDHRMITLDSLFSKSRRSIPMILMDECHHIEPSDMWLRPEPREKDWERKTFKSGPATTPSEAVRQKRREKRKRKKGK